MTLGISVEGCQGRPGQTQDGRLLVNPVRSWQLPWPVAAVIFALAAVMILVLALAHNPHMRGGLGPHLTATPCTLDFTNVHTSST